jgi:hypothetical protein
MVEAGVPVKSEQERLRHSQADILSQAYAHVLDASADMRIDPSLQFRVGLAHAAD